MKLINAKELLAQAHILMHIAKVGVNSVYKAVVNRCGDLVSGKCSFKVG